MPKRTDIRNILIIGSGPIVIGQAYEFRRAAIEDCRIPLDGSTRIPSGTGAEPQP